MLFGQHKGYLVWRYQIHFAGLSKRFIFEKAKVSTEEAAMKNGEVNRLGEALKAGITKQRISSLRPCNLVIHENQG